jgi:SHS2 domain-containing protein
MEKFEILDVAGDAGIRAFGKSRQDLFVHAALGMYSLITNTDLLTDQKSITVSVESHSLDGLLVSWLNELIFHFDTYGFIGKKITITEFTTSITLPTRGGGLLMGEAFRITAILYGEEFDSERHEGKLLIKAATYHRLKIEKKDRIWETEIIFDI